MRLDNPVSMATHDELVELKRRLKSNQVQPGDDLLACRGFFQQDEVNPVTGRTITRYAKRWRGLRKTCATMHGGEQFCPAWALDPRTNPATGRTYVPGRGKWIEALRTCARQSAENACSARQAERRVRRGDFHPTTGRRWIRKTERPLIRAFDAACATQYPLSVRGIRAFQSTVHPLEDYTMDEQASNLAKMRVSRRRREQESLQQKAPCRNLYWEKQKAQKCAVHAINAFFGRAVTTCPELAALERVITSRKRKGASTRGLFKDAVVAEFMKRHSNAFLVTTDWEVGPNPSPASILNELKQLNVNVNHMVRGDNETPLTNAQRDRIRSLHLPPPRRLLVKLFFNLRSYHWAAMITGNPTALQPQWCFVDSLLPGPQSLPFDRLAGARFYWTLPTL